MKRIALILMVVLLVLQKAAIVRVQASETEGTYTLPLFETSDIHGYLVETSVSPNEYRLAYISDKVKDARSASGTYRKDRAILLDGGDIFQGNTASNVLKGHSMSAAFIRMDYDAVTIGNHEFDWKIENVIDPDGTLLDSQLDGTVEVNDIPVLCANLYKDRKKIDFAKPYVILEKTAVDQNGNEIPVRIAVIGFTHDYSTSIMHSNFTGAGFKADVDYSIVNGIALELESTGQADATILLVHGASSESAGSLGGSTVIDLVLGGHTHTNETGRTSFGLPYMQPAANATAYCYAELYFTVDDGGKPVFSGVQSAKSIYTTDYRSKMIPTEANASELDPELVSLTDRVVLEIDDLLSTRVGYITESARKNTEIPGSGGRSTTAGNWMSSIVARAVGADIGFFNSGGIRKEFIVPWLKGKLEITASDVYTMFPFENELYCFRLTFEELLELLQYSMTSAGSSLLSRMVGIDCYFTGQTVQALVYKDKAIYLNGQWKDGWKERTVKVGVSEFIVTSDRREGTLVNPLIAWSKTSRVVFRGITDVEGAFKVFDEESEQNKWHLEIDTKAHFINSAYVELGWTTEDDTPVEPESEEETGTKDPEETASESEPENIPQPGRPEFEPDLPDQPIVPVLIIGGVALVLVFVVLPGIVGLVVLLVIRAKKKRNRITEQETEQKGKEE